MERYESQYGTISAGVRTALFVGVVLVLLAATGPPRKLLKRMRRRTSGENVFPAARTYYDGIPGYGGLLDGHRGN